MSNGLIGSVLVVDDSPDTLQVLYRQLTAGGLEVRTASSVAEAVRTLEEEPMDLVITDLKMPGGSGLDLVRHVRENCRDTEVMMITGYPSLDGAVQAVKTGAEEYLVKPFTEEELISAVRRALDKLELRRAGQEGGTGRPASFHGMIGSSPAMQRVFHTIRKAAAAPATVLISGESGTGKELAARAIHYGSRRSAAPFVAVNCSAIPETLLESELFGYVRGAFTGADQARAGFFQTADQGTIFLDEVSETALPMQTRLLRVLQEKEITMLGSSRPLRVDVRVLASTNKDLSNLVRKGTFREDLFYRLNVVSIELPPLRDRENDILVLAGHFCAKFAGEMDRPAPCFTDRALEILRDYDWPGNVRELENLIQRLVIMTEGDTIDVPDLPPGMRFYARRESGSSRTLAEVESEHILSVLRLARGNRTRAAQILDIDRKTLRLKLARIRESRSEEIAPD